MSLMYRQIGWRASTDMFYRLCAVPYCTSNTENSPTKIFIQVPKLPGTRKFWLERAELDFESYKDADIYFCVDHFDIEENFIGGPTKFDCQYYLKPSVPEHDLQDLLPDGINTEQCVEVTTSKTSSSENEDKITSSSENGGKITTSLKESARKTPSLTYNTCTIPPKKRRRRRRSKRSKITMNEFSELVQGTSFKPILMKASVPKPNRPKVPTILKKPVHNFYKNEIEELREPDYNNGKKEIEVFKRAEHNNGKKEIAVFKRTEHNNGKKEIEELKKLQFNNSKNEIEEENNPLYNNDTKQIQETINDDHKNDGLILTINGDKMKKPILNIDHDHDYPKTLAKRAYAYNLAKKAYAYNLAKRAYAYNYALIDHDYAINSTQMMVRKRKICSKKTETLYPNNSHGKRMYKKVKSNKINEKSDSSEKLTSTFQCFRCLKVFNRQVDFYYHFQEQHVTDDDSTQHKCNVCDRIYYCRTDLLEHISDEHVGNEETDSANSIQTFKCEHCDLEYIYKRHLTLHIKKNHLVNNGNWAQNCSEKTDSADSKSTFKCEHCGLEYIYKNSLMLHINRNHLVNNSKSTFKCVHCDLEYNNKRHLTLHIRKSHLVNNGNWAQNCSEKTDSADRKSRFKCEHCGLEYKYKRHLTLHIRRSHLVNNSKSTFKCVHCDLEYNNKRHLTLHIRKSHLFKNGNWAQNCSEKTDSADRKSRFKCIHCGLEFIYKKYLMFHIRRNHLVNNTDSADSKSILKCQYCDLVYINRRSLMRHIGKKHQGSSDRCLTQCDDDDDKHVRSLAENKLTLNCGYCGKEYLSAGNLINHLQNSHGFKSRSTLKCYYCDVKCRTKLNLFNHIKKHLKNQEESDIQEETLQIEDPFDIQEDTVCLQEQQPSEEQQLLDTQEQCTYTQEQCTYTQEQCTYTQEQCTYTQEQCTYTQEQCTYTQEQCTYTQEQCTYTQEACEYTQDECLDTDEETLDIQEEPLDIKPEIFQCSQCPSSFLYEAEMTNHLQIMHGNIVDLYEKKMNHNKRDAKNNDNASNSLIGKQCDKINGEDQKECEDNYAGCNFGELEVEIKKEFINPLEDIDLPDEQQLQLNLMSDLDPEFLENQYNIKYGTYDTVLGIYPQDKIDLENKHLNPEAVSIKVERMESDEIECSYFDNEDGHCNSQIPLGNFCFNMEIIKCKCCQKTFPNQEALLDHMHELVNEKTKLYADAKQALLWNYVQSKEPKIKLEKKHKKDSRVSNNADAIRILKSNCVQLKRSKIMKLKRKHADVKPVLKSNHLKLKAPKIIQSEKIHTVSNNGAKQVLNSNFVQLMEPKVILNKIHNIPNKNSTSRNHNLNDLQFVGSNVIDDKKQDINEPIDISVCRRCSKRLPIKIQMSKYDKICKKCKRIDLNEKKRKRAKANRELKKSIHGSGSGSDIPKPLTLSDEQILENMHRFFNKTLKKRSFTPNAIENDLTIKNIEVQEEIAQNTFNIEDNDLFKPETLLIEGNDLLQPLREEDEKILVQAHDPNLCKSCLIPLDEQENTGTNKTSNTLCNKCKASENCNEIRRKSNEKKKSSDNYNDKISSISDNELSCQICKCKFRNKLGLRKHVARSHL